MSGKSAVWGLILTWGLLLGTVAGACAGSQSATTQSPTCPACECSCDCSEAGEASPAGQAGATDVVDPHAGLHTGAAGPDVAGMSGDLAELASSAARKTAHDDGKGCLADLDRIAKIDPRMDQRMAIARGQCEMLVGQCQEGKKRIMGWMKDQQNMSHEMAERMADTQAAVYCRGGNSSDRDKLRRALHELQDGAYVTRKSSRWCAERINVARRLIPKVKPRDMDDTQIEQADRLLWSMGPVCHGRAGDCRAALTVFRQLAPKGTFPSGLDPAQRDEIIFSSFDAMVRTCKGTRRTSGSRP